MIDSLRPCLIDDGVGTSRKALFHCWAYEAYPKERELSLIGSPAGQVCILWGIVEVESGRVLGVPPEKIRFVDNPFRDYAWPDGGDGHGI